MDRAAEEAALADHQRAEEVREEAERTRNALREAARPRRPPRRARTRPNSTGPWPSCGPRTPRPRRGGRRARRPRGPGPGRGRAHTPYGQRQEAERRAAARTSRRETLARERADLLAELERARGADATVGQRAARLERQAGLLAHAAEAARAPRRPRAA
ncbi:hypothetical protein [Streptomyces malaysiensis]|uniref:hypothetical protein n=1 Tax=Streptomyces malaysiensis TaxID=92644 RepID=UPI0032D57B9D